MTGSLALLLAMHFNSQSQQLDSTLATYSRNYIPEKAYLHYDKSSYMAGETIWYKVYLMEGLFPAEDSRNIYVDWVSEKGEVLAHYASPLISGISIGQFDIPADFKGNLIHVRAYTRWMLNFDSSVIYKKQIRIHPKDVIAKSPMPAIVPALHFFPEGGELVAGIPNRVAFKATDQWGRPVTIRGSLREKNEYVDTLRTVHDGMGSLYFIPKEGVQYAAKWRDEKGTLHTTPLPVVKNKGITVQVTASPNKRTIQLNLAPGTGTEPRMFTILGTMQGNQIFKTSGTALPGNGFRKIISTENIPTGILVLTVFDEDWNAVAERISFINNEDYLIKPEFSVARWGLNKRARNEVEIKLPDNFGEGSLSVSVTDAGIDHDSTQNIFTHFLLSSELKGLIHNPSYYFKDNSETRVHHLDLVMLTNGWRRFKWDDIAKGKLPEIKYQKDTSYLSLSGQIYGAPKSQLTGNESIVLFVKMRDSAASPVILNINRDGSFRDPGYLFFDTLKVYYQVKSKFLSSAGANFMIDKLAAPSYAQESKSFAKNFPFNFDTTIGYHTRIGKESRRLKEELLGNIMEMVTVRAKAKTPIQELEEKYPSGLFKSDDSYKFDIMDDPFALGKVDVLHYLTGRIAGLQINTLTIPPQLSWRGASPSMFLDEMPADVELIRSIPVADIAYIKVFRPPFMGASMGGAGGAIAIYTKRGDDQRKSGSSSGGLSLNTITGFAPIKEFYSPNYSSFEKQHENKDLRTTLYWNGMINTTPENKTVKFSFYNNDVTKSFRIIVEGFNKDGIFTHFEEIME